MTDKDMMSLDNAPKPEDKPAAKPRISKADVEPAEPVAAAPALSGAETTEELNSKGREALLQIDSYTEAESLLSKSPELIEQARAVFGAIVPTTGQNEFMDLAIKAAADDDPMDLRAALQAKRQRALNMTAPEAGQLLEFANEQMNKTPALALNVAMLLTDDLTRLEDASMWQKQKDILLTAGKSLDLDPTTLWEEISRVDAPKVMPPKPQPAEVEAKPEPPKVEAPKRPTPPPPPVSRPAAGKGPSRLFLVVGFFFLMSFLSCGICAMSQLFG